jgi:hypothetical protein
MAYTEEQLKAAAKKAAEAGDMAAAEELARAAMVMRGDPPTERARAALGQGLFLGFGDEILAGIRSLSPNQTYDEALADERKRVADYRTNYPNSSFAYEMGGAILPALAAGLVSGGTGTGGVMGATALRAAPTVGRAALAGAGTGAVYGFGSGEGGLANRAGNAVIDAGLGAVGGAGGQVLASVVAKPLEKVVDFARRTIGGRASSAVQAEVQRLAAESGMSVDEIIDKVANGQMMAEVSDTLRYAARAYKAGGGEASSTISDAFKRREFDGSTWTRAGETRGGAQDALQGALAPGMGDNVLGSFTAGQSAARAAEKDAYTRAFGTAAPLTPEIVDALGEALRRDPEAAQYAARLVMARTGRNPYFTVDQKTGQVLFGRAPTLEEAELVRRALVDTKDAAYRAGQGGVGEALGEVEAGVRQQLDEFSPDLQSARTTAAANRTARDAFEAGRTALNRPADAVMLEFEQVVAQGEAAVRAYRAGLMDQLRKTVQSPSGASLMPRLADPNKGQGMILNYVMPAEQRDYVLKLIGQAADSQEAQNVIMGGSPTAQTLLGQGQQGSAGMVVDIMSASRGDIPAAMRVIDQAARKAMEGLSEKQKVEVARLLVQRDPTILQRALVDEGGLMALQQRVEQIGALVRRGGAAAGTVAAPPMINERPR